MEEINDKVNLSASDNSEINECIPEEPHAVFVPVPDVTVKQELFEEKLPDDQFLYEWFTSDISTTPSEETIVRDVHYGNEDGPQACEPEMSETLPAPQVLQQNRIQDCVGKVFECNVCNKSFTHTCYLAQHKLVHTYDECNKAFTQRVQLLRYKNFLSGIKMFTCDICHKAYTRLGYLSEHKLIHMGIKRFHCDICSKDFTRSCDLSKHKLIHSDIKRFQCDVCNKAFRRQDYLVKHKLVHSDKRFHCDLCKRAFISQHICQDIN